jgi:MoxR-like ATPase
MKLSMEYPSFESEKEILKQARGIGRGHKTNAVLSHDEIQKLKEKVQNIKINDTVESYLLQIVRETRQHPEIDLGVSPRGALALMKAAQGQALLENREYVIPEDIKKMVPYVLCHRIILSTEASFTKSPELVLREVLEAVPVPVELGT